jgi:hypothetical protein
MYVVLCSPTLSRGATVIDHPIATAAAGPFMRPHIPLVERLPSRHALSIMRGAGRHRAR